MPTGYTSTLYDGEQTFDDFLLSCARAFGALVTMRDDPPDAEIPEEFKPSPYHLEKRDAAKRRLTEVKKWTLAQAQENAALLHESQMIAWQREDETRRARKARYEEMLAAAQAWQPPTPDHEELRKFMIQQLTESIDFDCTPWPAPEKQTGADYKASEIKRAERDIAYHEKNYAEEMERAYERTAWVKALRESVGIAA